jgi:hypothetical protein
MCRVIALVAGCTFASAADIAGAQTQEIKRVIEELEAVRPIVHVGLFATRADGSPTGAAYTTNEDPSFKGLHTLVYVGRCSLGGGASNPPATATDAWRIAGQVLSTTAEEAVIHLDWQRVLSDGQPTAMPGGSGQFTLRVGERTILDTVANLQTGGCGDHPSTSISFEARFAPRAFGIFGSAWMGRGAGGSARGGAGGGAVGGAAGASGSGRGGVRAGSAHAAYSAEIWLVRTLASGQVDTQQLPPVPIAAGESPFAFRPVTIAVANGTLNVRVSGTIQFESIGPGWFESAVGGERGFRFAADSEVTFTPSNRPARDPAQKPSRGSARANGRIPSPDSVLEFRLPPLEAPGGSSQVPDRFAVRLRIRPAS